MKNIRLFKVIILGNFVGLSLISCSPIKQTYTYNLKADYQGNICFNLGNFSSIKKHSSIILEQGSECSRWSRPTRQKFDNKHYLLQVAVNSSLNSQVTLTILDSQPMSPNISMEYGDCQKGSVHIFVPEQVDKYTFERIIATVFAGVLLWMAIGFLFALYHELCTLNSWSKAELISLAELQSKLAADNYEKYIRVRGKIECENPLISPLTKEPCVDYRFSVRRKYKQGKRTIKGVVQEHKTVPFILQEGKYQINLTSEEANIRTKYEKRELSKDSPLSVYSFNLGAISYEYKESILPVGASVIVVGLATAKGIIKPQKSQGFPEVLLITTETEKEFSQNTRAGILCLVFLMVIFGAWGSQRAIFSFKYWQMSTTEACRLEVKN